MKKLFLFFCCLQFASALFAQEKHRNYLIEFTDRNNSPFSLNDPLKFLSQRALDRRSTQGIALAENDIPVNPHYVDSLQKAGVKILFTSKWFNAAAIELTDTLLLYKINDFPFVKQSQRLRKKAIDPEKSIFHKSDFTNAQFTEEEYGESYQQIEIHNGQQLHKAGLQGQGKMIAVIDAGFYKVNELKAFQSLHENSQIVAVRNFVDEQKSVYEGSMHGMYVLSVIGGELQGGLIGTAPRASYILAKSENDTSEYLVEEDAWAAAAEWADSAGADIINSSLGYTTFDDPQFNHTYQDLDGKTTHSSIAATIAARKGMIVVNSAGNSGTAAWRYIGAPADADSILSIGAINKTGDVAAFSSRGPSADGRIKPDVVAVGVGTICAAPKDGDLALVNGTSLSAPVITGLTACLWQAFPEKKNMEIIEAIRQSSDRFSNPDDSAGYGIPNFVKAYSILKGAPFVVDKNKITLIYPNPFYNNFSLDFYSEENQQVSLFITDAMGRIVFTSGYNVEAYNFTNIRPGDLSHLPAGLYMISILEKDNLHTRKVIKGSGN